MTYKKIITSIMLALLTSIAYGQIAIFANVPPSSAITNVGYPVFSGSTRQISVDISNGIVATTYLASGGSGYVSGDVGSYLTIQQTGSSGTATVQITGVSGGSISSIAGTPTIGGTGYYTTDLNISGQPTTGGSGTGAIVSISTTQCTTSSYNCTVNWSVSSSSGGATATFTDPTHTAASSISGALPTIQVNIGGTGTSCNSYTSPPAGTSGAVTFSCQSEIVVQAQSTDDTSKTATFKFFVLANLPSTLANGTSSLLLYPAYNQVFAGQITPLQTNVVGCAASNQGVTWSITSQPSGGNGVLVDTNPADSVVSRDAAFSATVAGEYAVTATSTCNSSTSTAYIYVSSRSMPYLVTPNKTRPFPCEVDSARFSTDYEVGSGYAYANLSATPYTSSSQAGVIIRVHNTDTTGLSPTVYNEYFMIHNPGGTLTAPYMLCGVPDSLGNLPIISGASGAVTQAGASPALMGCGILTVIGPSHFGAWQNGSTGPFYFTVAGLHIREAQLTDYYNYPSGITVNNGCIGPTGPGSNQMYWQSDAAGIYFGGGSYLTAEGNMVENTPNSFFSAENANSNEWSTITEAVASIGNNYTGYFNSSGANAHAIYAQSYYMLEEGDYVHDPYPSATALGADFKWRGLGLTQRYNYFGAGSDIPLDYVDNQDGGAYMDIGTYFQGGGWGAPGSNTDTAGIDNISAYTEGAQDIFSYGNQVFGGSTTLFQIHYGTDHDGSGMIGQTGILHFYNNTVYPAQIEVDTGYGIQTKPYLQQRAYLQNNIFWSQNSWFALNAVVPVVFDNRTNLFLSGSMVITTPITGGSYSSHSAHGFQSGCYPFCMWPMTSPLNTYIYNLTSGNYLTTGTAPMSLTTLVPVSGSAAISAGSALYGTNDLLPVRYQYNNTSNILFTRSNPLTIGSNDESALKTNTLIYATQLYGVTIYQSGYND